MAGDANGVLMQWRFPSMALEQSISAVGALRCRGALVAPWHGTARRYILPRGQYYYESTGGISVPGGRAARLLDRGR